MIEQGWKKKRQAEGSRPRVLSYVDIWVLSWEKWEGQGIVGWDFESDDWGVSFWKDRLLSSFFYVWQGSGRRPVLQGCMYRNRQRLNLVA